MKILGRRFRFSYAGICFLLVVLIVSDSTLMRLHIDSGAEPAKLFPVVTVVMGICLFFAFRSMRLLLLPFLALLLANGLNAAFSALPAITGWKTGVLTAVPAALVAAIGVSDSVQLVAYYNLLMALGRDRKEAVAAVRSRGGVCVMAATVAATGFASLHFAGMKELSCFGFLAAAGILVSMTAALVLAPAAMKLLPPGKETYAGALGVDGGPAIGHVNALVQKFPAQVLAAGALAATVALFGCTRLIIETKLPEHTGVDNPIVSPVNCFQNWFSRVLSGGIDNNTVNGAPGFGDGIIYCFLFTLAMIFFLTAVKFRSPRIGFVSIIQIAISILFVVGFMGFAGITLRVSTSAMCVGALCAAMDGAMHFLTHYQRMRRQYATPRGAAEHSLRAGGGALILSSGIVVLGFSALLFSSRVDTVHLGLLTICGMAAALFGNLFILPSLLILFDRKGN